MLREAGLLAFLFVILFPKDLLHYSALAQKWHVVHHLSHRLQSDLFKILSSEQLIIHLNVRMIATEAVRVVCTFDYQPFSRTPILLHSNEHLDGATLGLLVEEQAIQRCGLLGRKGDFDLFERGEVLLHVHDVNLDILVPIAHSLDLAILERFLL